MSTYELDDEVVREFLGTLHESEDELPSGKIGGALKEQLPIPAPRRIGAVVQTSMTTRGPRTFVRTSTDGHTANPWQLINAPDEPALPTEQIGRITEVLSEGVDL